MACIVSTGSADEQNWLIQNAIYSWFVRLATARSSDEEVLSRLTVSEYTNGISLEDLLREDPVAARELALLLRGVAAEIAAGQYPLTDDTGRQRPEMQEGTQESFSKLVSILDAWLAAKGQC